MAQGHPRSTAAVLEAERPEPQWEVAELFPGRGEWTEPEFLGLSTNRLIELSDGCLEVLSVPTEIHQFLVRFLMRALEAFVEPRGLGVVLFAGLRVRLWPGKMRSPDVVFMRAENAHRRKLEYWEGADLMMEVVSPDPGDRKRDLEIKPAEYARGRIPEYWIVDPEQRRATVLALEGDAYRVHGEFGPGTEADSVLLPGFAVSVDALFASAE